MEVHAAGGGIGYTVGCVHQATEAELAASLQDRLLGMLRKGTTLVEAKSGYGLDLENEVLCCPWRSTSRSTMQCAHVFVYCTY